MDTMPQLSESLAMLAEAALPAQDPWWIIGSAAVALHGFAVPRIRDIDLMMSSRDARGLLHRVGAEPAGPGPSDLFRSEVFGRWGAATVPIEVFGGFQLCRRGIWQAVVLGTREEIAVGAARVYVPSVAELGRLLESFGRPKDRQRARLLRP